MTQPRKNVPNLVFAAKKYGLKNAYLSTGGGATLQYLEKGKLKF